MKEIYREAEMEIILFNSPDVITTSGDSVAEGEENGDD